MEKVIRIPANEFDHHRGPLGAPVTIIQYGDYECPYSASLAPVMDRLVDEYGDDLCHVFRHFPQRGIHPNSEFAATAAEAAGEQDKFWELHSLLFENSEDLSPDYIRLLARKSGLNMDEFEQGMKNFELYQKVRDDYNSGVESGISSTPTIYINEVLFEGSSSYWPLKEAIEIDINNYRSVML